MKLALVLLILSLAGVCLADGEYGYHYHYYHKSPKTPKPPTPTPPTPPPPSPPTPPLNTQECSDNLGELMDGNGNTLMDNSCTPFVLNDDQRFRFEVSFLAPYIFNDECLDLEVVYEETILANGGADLNEWSFNADTQTIVWNISLSDFVDVYGCEWIADDDQYTWICEFKVNIYFMGMIQQCYNAKIQVTLDRVYENELIVNVQKNTVIGECCENALSINTVLRFCTTFECTDFLPSPLTVIRKEDFYIEHRILSPGFNDFFLSLVTVSLGDFLPVIVDSAVEAGRIRLALRSNIAKPNLVLTVICQLQKNARRFLQEGEEIPDDYKLKAEGQMSIVNPDDYQQIQEQQSLQQKSQDKVIIEQSNSGLMIGAIAAVAVLFVAATGVSVFCFMKRRKQISA